MSEAEVEFLTWYVRTFQKQPSDDNLHDAGLKAGYIAGYTRAVTVTKDKYRESVSRF